MIHNLPGFSIRDRTTPNTQPRIFVSRMYTKDIALIFPFDFGSRPALPIKIK